MRGGGSEEERRKGERSRGVCGRMEEVRKEGKKVTCCLRLAKPLCAAATSSN